jgi:hypothetical protein
VDAWYEPARANASPKMAIFSTAPHNAAAMTSAISRSWVVPGIDRRGDQHRFAGHRHAYGLEADKQHDDPVAVDRQQMVQLVPGEVQIALYPSTVSRGGECVQSSHACDTNYRRA